MRQLEAPAAALCIGANSTAAAGEMMQRRCGAWPRERAAVGSSGAKSPRRLRWAALIAMNRAGKGPRGAGAGFLSPQASRSAHTGPVGETDTRRGKTETMTGIDSMAAPEAPVRTDSRAAAGPPPPALQGEPATVRRQRRQSAKACSQFKPIPQLYFRFCAAGLLRPARPEEPRSRGAESLISVRGARRESRLRASANPAQNRFRRAATGDCQ